MTSQPPAQPLELTRREMRSLVDATFERIANFYDTLPTQPVQEVDTRPERWAHLRQDLPEDGRPIDELLELFFGDLVPNCFNTTSPGFMAYIPGGGLFHAAVADLIADSVNRYVTVWAAAPGLAEIENSVIRWFRQMVGYPEDSSGFLTSGGSLANFSALFTARKEKLPEEFLDGRIYVSDQTHHSVLRAASLVGFPSRSVRTIPTNQRFQLRCEALEDAIASDRAAGVKPFAIVASAGTTNTGAIDDLTRLAAVAQRERLWLHVDAAYGGFFALTERGRQRMTGIELADSITLDPHKGLFLPYGTGCLLVRDGAALERAHSIDADYMPPMQGSTEQVDFCNISPELSRDFRGLRIWLPIQMTGIGAWRDALDEKLDLTEWAWRELETIPGMRIVAEPQLSVVAFRLELDGLGRLQNGAHDRINRDLLDRINSRQRVYLTGTVLDGHFALRICVVVFRTHK
ncbi:MAG: aminotransferase class I/II-fold pyridoxal phosphate-dependent enzyme, partial [Acidobacteriota bacterium]|nr:aminotransferase class I/II-fold pyridoxal phosphate-dependent enzyme [Acidobacteriota bacterium]